MIATQRGRRAVASIGRAVAAAGVAQLVAVTAVTAWAAEGEGHGAGGDPWRALLWKTINLAVLLGLLYVFGRKPIAAMFRGAAQRTKATLDDERERTRLAEAEAAGQRKRIEDLEAELQRMVGEARQEARAEHDRLVHEAQQHAERIRGTVQLQVAQEFNKARKELQAELAQQTIRLAEELIRQKLDDAARERIVSRAIDQLGAGS